MTERGLPSSEGAPACPFVAFADERDARSTSPDHRHRCFAESPPAPRAVAHQEAYCLSSAFPVCPVFQEWARREAARADGSVRSGTASGAVAGAAAVSSAAGSPGAATEPSGGAPRGAAASTAFAASALGASAGRPPTDDDEGSVRSTPAGVPSQQNTPHFRPGRLPPPRDRPWGRQTELRNPIVSPTDRSPAWVWRAARPTRWQGVRHHSSRTLTPFPPGLPPQARHWRPRRTRISRGWSPVHSRTTRQARPRS
jgi:hypothetical protein